MGDNHGPHSPHFKEGENILVNNENDQPNTGRQCTEWEDQERVKPPRTPSTKQISALHKTAVGFGCQAERNDTYCPDLFSSAPEHTCPCVHSAIAKTHLHHTMRGESIAWGKNSSIDSAREQPGPATSTTQQGALPKRSLK